MDNIAVLTNPTGSEIRKLRGKKLLNFPAKRLPWRGILNGYLVAIGKTRQEVEDTMAAHGRG